MLGSCFAEEVGGFMRQYFFDVTINPHGIIFNPLSLAAVLHRYMHGEAYTEKDLLPYEQTYYSLSHHGSFSAKDKTELITCMNDALQTGMESYRKSDTILVTLGSAWVYEYNQTREVVANCHKLPGNLFNKRLLRTDEIINAWMPILQAMQKAGKHILFTVSPVRYVRDGLHENNLSKSVLHLALNELCNMFGNAHYFPAFEIVNDELRDYRFFKEDLVHPNAIAVKYVFERFTATACDEFTREYLKAVSSYITLANHKVMSPDKTNLEQHQAKIAQLKSELLARYDFLQTRF